MIHPQWSELVLGQAVRGTLQKRRPNTRIRTPEGGKSYTATWTSVGIVEELTPKLCQIFNNDSVRTVKLTTFIKEMLGKAQAVCGPQNFNSRYASKMDATVSDQLTKLLAA